MTTIAIYEGREINLSALSPADFQAIKGLRGQIHKGDRILLCKASRGDREMHVAKSPVGLYFARHFSGGGHGQHVIARMSDAHLRGTDTWLQGWQNAGVRTGTEVSTNNRLRLDAVAFGPRITALETQVEPQKTPVVKRRHTQRINVRSFIGKHAQLLTAPLQVVWFAPVGRPDWLYKVPTIECGNRSWEATPAPNTVAAIGVQSFDVRRCGSVFFPICPEKRTGQCDGAHLWREPRPGLSIEDVAAMLADGELAAVELPSGIFLTDRLGLARCKSFGFAVTEPKTKPEPRPVRRLTACDWKGHEEAPAEWATCATCKRRYRPEHATRRCHYCLYGGSPVALSANRGDRTA